MTNEQAAKVILEALGKRIKRRLKNGTLTMADSYIASLLLKEFNGDKEKEEKKVNET